MNQIPLKSEEKKSPPRSWQRRLARGLGLFVGIPYLVIAGGMFFLQREMIFPRTKTPPLRSKDQSIPSGELQDVSYRTHDGLTLNGWRYRPDQVLGGQASGGQVSRKQGNDSRRVMLCFPGNAGSRQDRVSEAMEFLDLGWDVYYFDYRGYADNPGSPSEASFVKDALEVWKFVLADAGVPAERVLICGESMGGGVSIALASELCRSGTPPWGLIVYSTFSSLAETASRHYPWLPVRLLLVDQFDSAKRIRDVDCPLAILHGDQDELVPIELARRLFAAAPEQSRAGVPKTFQEIKGAGHNQIPYSALAGGIRALVDRAEKMNDEVSRNGVSGETVPESK